MVPGCCARRACTCTWGLVGERARAHTEPPQALPEACQALYMRLHQRVGPWFRTAALEYSEVADMPATVQQLADAGFAARLGLSDPAGLQSLAEARPACLDDGPARQHAWQTAPLSSSLQALRLRDEETQAAPQPGRQ